MRWICLLKRAHICDSHFHGFHLVCWLNINDIYFIFCVSETNTIPSGTLLQANSTVSENVIQSVPLTTISSGAKEQIKGGEEKKMKEKIEKKGILL